MKKQKRNTVLTRKPFKPGWDTLPAKMQKGVMNTLRERCGWLTYQTFFNKKHGNVPIRPPEIEIVEETFKAFNLDPWTGEYLNEQAGMTTAFNPD